MADIPRCIEALKNPNNKAVWDEFVRTRPPMIQDMIQKFPPWKLYKINSGHRVQIQSYCENGTVTVSVTEEFNYVAMNRNVFGVTTDQLVECDLPGPDEKLGCFQKEFDIPEEEMVEHMRQTIQANKDKEMD